MARPKVGVRYTGAKAAKTKFNVQDGFDTRPKRGNSRVMEVAEERPVKRLKLDAKGTGPGAGQKTHGTTKKGNSIEIPGQAQSMRTTRRTKCAAPRVATAAMPSPGPSAIDDCVFSDDELAIKPLSAPPTVATPRKQQRTPRTEIPPTPPSTRERGRIKPKVAECEIVTPRKADAASALPPTPAPTPTAGKGKGKAIVSAGLTDNEPDLPPALSCASTWTKDVDAGEQVNRMDLDVFPRQPAAEAGMRATSTEMMGDLANDTDETCFSAADAASRSPPSEDGGHSQIDDEEFERLSSSRPASPSSPADSRSAVDTSTRSLAGALKRARVEAYPADVAISSLHSLLPVLSGASPLPLLVPSSTDDEPTNGVPSLDVRRHLAEATPCLIGMAEWEQDLRRVLGRTIWEGEGNAMVLIGGRGSGKSAVSSFSAYGRNPLMSRPRSDGLPNPFLAPRSGARRLR